MRRLIARGLMMAAGLACLPLNMNAFKDDALGNENKIIWCSPDGNDATADGSEENPFYSLQLAVDMAQPGDRINMLAGTYYYDWRVDIHNREDFVPVEGVYTEIWGIGGQAILDFSRQPDHEFHSRNIQRGIRLTSSYWHLKNLDICNAADNGLIIERRVPDMDKEDAEFSKTVTRTDEAHDNIIEMCNFYRNGDTGLQIMNLGAYNKIINCDSYFNCDIGHGDADGFAPKVSVGDGNYFYGCRAYMNSDDGWDTFYKTDGGFPDDMTLILENCITFRNGYLENGIPSDGNGNGFKCGSANGATHMYMQRCVSVGHPKKGFDQNHNMGDIIINNCTAYHNGQDYAVYEGSERMRGNQVKITNSISINSGGFPNVTGVSGSEFLGLNELDLIAPRNQDGSLPDFDFAHPREGSVVIDKGVEIPANVYRGIPVNAVEYKGTAPDLGAYEFIPDEEVETGVKGIEKESSTSGLSLFMATDGTLFITVHEAGMPTYKASFYNVAGQLLHSFTFSGTTASCRLPEGLRGVTTLVVEGDTGYCGNAKFLIK